MNEGKVNEFKDERLVGGDGIGDEEAELLKFQKERRKKVDYSLNDDDGHEHHDEALAEAIMRSEHGPTAGGASTSAREGVRKTKREIMDEIIAKSKQYRAERQKESETLQDETDRLDRVFSSLVNTSIFRPKTKDLDGQQRPAPDAYDMAVKELVFERRVRPSDRTKTEDEVAQETAERLRLEEARRLRRMKGIVDEVDDALPDLPAGGFARRRALKRIRDAAAGDEAGGGGKRAKRGGVEDIVEGEDGETRRKRLAKHEIVRPGGNFSSDEDEDEDDGDEDGDEDGDGDEDSDDEEEESGEDGAADDSGSSSSSSVSSTGSEARAEKARAAELARKRRASLAAMSKEARAQLPFVFEVPPNFEEWSALIRGRSLAEMATILERMVACNHVSLKPENRKKLCKLFDILLEQFDASCATMGEEGSGAYGEVNLIASVLTALSPAVGGHSAKVLRTRLQRIDHRLRKSLSDGHSGWPGPESLLLLRFIVNCYPMSDHYHPVASPAMLVMAQFLIRCPVTSANNAIAGLFVASLVAQSVADSRRLVPEVLVFLRRALDGALDGGDDGEKDDGKPGKPGKVGKLDKGKGGDSGLDLDSDPRFPLWMIGKRGDVSGAQRRHALDLAMSLVTEFSRLYRDLPAFPELFSPLVDLLDRTAAAAECVKELRSVVQAAMSLRVPVQRAKKAAPSIKMLTPAFTERFSLHQAPDPDRARAEAKRLKKEHQRELKGAARELKKDNYFIAAEQQKRRREEDDEYKKTIGKIMSTLEDQQHDMKEEKRERDGHKLKRLAERKKKEK